MLVPRVFLPLAVGLSLLGTSCTTPPLDRAAAAWKVLGETDPGPVRAEHAGYEYRQAVTSVVRDLASQPPARWPRQVELPGKNGPWTLHIAQGGRNVHEVWSPAVLDRVRIIPALEQRRPEKIQVHRPGLGAPLLGIHKPRKTDVDAKFIPAKGQYLPVTAAIDFQGPAQATLHLLDPREVDTMPVLGQERPVAADFLKPVLKSLRVTNFLKATVGGTLRPGNFLSKNGLFLMEPYRRDKVPVIFIHGLMADPHIWRAHAATLMADPDIGPRIQCWYFVYPTGLPVVASSKWFREALAELKSQVDPDHNDPGFKNILIIGHSMGGVIARMQVTNSGDIFWKTWFQCPPDQLKLDAASRKELKEMLFFKANPDVKRLIFMNTPHHGSRMAGSWLGRWGSSLVRSPGDMLHLVSQVATLDLDRINPNRGRFDTFGVDGIKSLRPDHPLIMDLARQPIHAKSHSIIGELFGSGADPSKSSDGVVPYESAHLEEAESEIVVPTWHGDVANRWTVRELRRILREHLNLKPLPAEPREKSSLESSLESLKGS